MMWTEATATTVSGGRAAPAALCLQARAWSRTSKVLDLDAASPTAAPSLGSSVGVPFLWEEAPGRPKVVVAPEDFAPPPPAPAAAERTPVSHGGEAAGGGHRGDGDKARRVAPLKLPPRLQAAAAAAAAADSSLSPKNVLHGPYSGGGNKPPRPLTRSGSTASYRRKPSAGVSLWKKATAAARGKKHDHDAAALDASCRSPASSSSSSSSISYFADDHRRQADGHDDPEPEDGEECGDKSTVRITRFRRNRSLPSVTTSHLWASIRRSVKQITPWS